MQKEIGYQYSDIYLIPKMGILKSRDYADTSVILGKRKFALPVVPANMQTIVDINTCKYLASKEIFYIMHRFGVDNVLFCKEMINSGYFTSISVGVTNESIYEIKKLAKECITPDYITIDIAHGYSIMMRDMIKIVKEVFPDSFLICGNVVTNEGAWALDQWGADAIKCGIGQGSVCETKNTTGYTVPQFTANLNASSYSKKPIIADGGIREIGDIAKAIVSGASMVMAGGLFAGYNENPKKYLDYQGIHTYFGSASGENKLNNKYIEGKTVTIQPKGPMDILLDNIKFGLRSAISYCGGTNLIDLKVSDSWGVNYK